MQFSVLFILQITPRAQNAHAYVNAGFLIEFGSKNGVVDKSMVKSARVCYGGINPRVSYKNSTFYTENN